MDISNVTVLSGSQKICQIPCRSPCPFLSKSFAVLKRLNLTISESLTMQDQSYELGQKGIEKGTKSKKKPKAFSGRKEAYKAALI